MTLGTKWYDLGTKWYGLGYEMVWDESAWVRNDLIPNSLLSLTDVISIIKCLAQRVTMLLCAIYMSFGKFIFTKESFYTYILN